MRWEEIMHPIFGRSLYVTDERSELTVPLAYGIRIARFSLVGGQNVFFEQPKDMKEFTTEEGWRLYGGHRLWIARNVTRTIIRTMIRLHTRPE